MCTVSISFTDIKVTKHVQSLEHIKYTFASETKIKGLSPLKLNQVSDILYKKRKKKLKRKKIVRISMQYQKNIALTET